MFPCFSLNGSPHEIGLQHGRLAKRQIDKCIETYQQLFRGYAKMEWSEAVDQAAQYINYIEKYDPDIMAEIKGIAEGSGRDLLEIVALNARSEIMLTTKALDGCTSFGILPEAANGTAYMGQNWDWKDSVFEALIILEITQENKPKIKMITEAGIVGKFGLNDAGVGVCMNALACDQNGPGTPLHIAMRGILNSRNMGDAIASVINTNIASAVNFVIGHRDGQILDLEVVPSEFDVLYPEDGILVHTNHFVSPVLKMKVKDLTKHLLPDSLVRYTRAQSLLRNLEGGITFSGLQNMLSDHFNAPHGICRHQKVDPLGRELVTVFSFIMDLTNQEIFIAAGKPCETSYQKLQAG